MVVSKGHWLVRSNFFGSAGRVCAFRYGKHWQSVLTSRDAGNGRHWRVVPGSHVRHMEAQSIGVSAATGGVATVVRLPAVRRGQQVVRVSTDEGLRAG